MKKKNPSLSIVKTPSVKADSFKVMIVDDQPDVMDMLGDRLPATWQIDKFTDAKQAVIHYNQNPTYDVVITDVNMSPKNGKGLIYDIKHINSKQKIIVMSGEPGDFKLPNHFEVKVFHKLQDIKFLIDALIEMSYKVAA